MVLLTSPLIIIAHVNLRGKAKEFGPIRLIAPILENKAHNKALLLWNIFLGKIHIVGSSLTQSNNAPYSVKPGIVGYAQIHQTRILSETDTDNYLLYYLQNYSIWLDIDIMVKSIFSNYSVLEHLEKASKN